MILKVGYFKVGVNVNVIFERLCERKEDVINIYICFNMNLFFDKLWMY